MTMSPSVMVRVMDEKGVGRIRIAAGFGFAGAFIAVVVPILFLLLVTDFPGGFFTLNPLLVDLTSILVILGAVFLLLSLFFYRRSFAALRKVDRNFVTASVLCILGSIGFLLILVTAALVAGDSSSLLNCAHGQPTKALSCLRSLEPFGAATATIGFVLGWLGGLGIVVGLFLAGSRFRAGALTAAAIAYVLLLVVLILPFVGLLVTVPGIAFLIIAAPILGLVAPAAALAGSRRIHHVLSPR